MVLKRAKALRREGHLADALAHLASGIATGSLPPEKLDAAGRFVLEALAAGEAFEPVHSVLLLGQCTTSFLKTALAAVAFSRGLRLSVEDGGYDSILQNLATPGDRPDVCVMIPWHQRLLASDGRSPRERIGDEVAFFRQAWSLVEGHGSRLVQVGYDWVGPGAGGYALAGSRNSPVGLVRAANEALREALPENAYFVDLAQIAGAMGRRSFYEPRTYYWTKQPFGWKGLELLAKHLSAAIRAVTSGPKKVLVLDLDNTIWGGIVGEEGALGIRLGGDPEGEAFLAFQSYCKRLTTRGTLLAACSKNDPAAAREPFEKNPDMVLALEDFAAFEASWDPKSVAIERIARTLRLGLDSFVFFDDSPAERAQVGIALPMVDVVDVPDDPADFVPKLEDDLYFEAVATTTADHQRSQQYRAEAERREIQQSLSTIEEYLESLEMRADVRPIVESDMARVVQLLGKTNQFNLTTHRHSTGDVRHMLAQPGSLGRTLRLRDRFGDYGLVSVVIGVPLPGEGRRTLRLDTWLMSCRAIARTVEDFMLNHVAIAAREAGYEVLMGEYLPTAKNKLVSDLYSRLGFAPVGKLPPDGTRFVLSLAGYAPRDCAISAS